MSPLPALEPLLAEVRDCRLCAAHLPMGPRPILQMAREARILIAGQAPGRRVHESGVPWDDASGERLREWLGLDAERFYNPKLVALLPMGLCYPGTGTQGDLPPRPECAPAWRTRLLAQLPALQISLFIGQYAQSYHLPFAKGGVTERVQAWREHWPTQMPLPHPSPRNRRWLAANPWFAAELLPALRARVAEVLKLQTP